MASSFAIKDYRLNRDVEPVPFIRSPNQSDTFRPEGIILHDTAGRLIKGSSVNWFQSPDARSSAHFVVERDGSLTQMVLLNRCAWHAGTSSYHGRKNVNRFAFGIEIVNIGKCEKARDGSFIPWFKQPYRQGDQGQRFYYAETPNHGAGWWLDYTKAQIRTVTALCEFLVAFYKLDFITPHWTVSPGRKVDTNPLFPLEELRASAFDRRPCLHANANLRRWPSYNDNIIMVVPQGSKVDILRSGTYQHEQNEPELWHLVEFSGQQGWVHGSLIQL